MWQKGSNGSSGGGGATATLQYKKATLAAYPTPTSVTFDKDVKAIGLVVEALNRAAYASLQNGTITKAGSASGLFNTIQGNTVTFTPLWNAAYTMDIYAVTSDDISSIDMDITPTT